MLDQVVLRECEGAGVPPIFLSDSVLRGCGLRSEVTGLRRGSDLRLGAAVEKSRGGNVRVFECCV